MERRKPALSGTRPPWMPSCSLTGTDWSPDSSGPCAGRWRKEDCKESPPTVIPTGSSAAGRQHVYNDDLARDHVRRAGSRLRALEVLMEEQSWADVVRESQEVVEITLKGLLRACRIEVPRLHDVSPVLLDNRELLP